MSSDKPMTMEDADKVRERVPEGFPKWELHEREGGYFIEYEYAYMLLGCYQLAPELARAYDAVRGRVGELERERDVARQGEEDTSRYLVAERKRPAPILVGPKVVS